jgi:hypothetical protein
VIRPRATGGLLLALVAATAPSFAQEGPSDNSGGAAPAAPAAAPAPQAAPIYPGVVAPPEDGAPIGGGNATESSSRPVTGDKEDGFDFAPTGPAAGTSFTGGKGGAVFLDNGPSSRVVGAPASPSVHTVQKGDTLWGICDQAFQNPYQWPRIWSYNPQIQNPHWIYPNEQVRLKAGVALAPQVMTPESAQGAAVTAPPRMVPDTVFLRDEGYVNEDSGLNWGSIVGSPLDKMYLSDFDQVYVKVAPEHDVKIGQELTVYRPVRSAPGGGQVISIQGTLRVDDWNPGSRIARAQIVETLDAIERGARVGPVPRKFIVVAPARNDANVTAHVLIASHPHVLYGQNQIVFIDQGEEAGLKPGNRLFVIRHGDAWWQSQISPQTSGRRIVGEKEEPAVVENLPRLQSDNGLPEEVVAELRVLDVQKKSATCLVSQSQREIEPNDVAVARKGY